MCRMVLVSDKKAEKRGGTFLPNFETKLKFDKMSIYSVKLIELCINKHFAGVKALHIVLNPINLACCGSQKHIPVTPSGTLTQMTDLRHSSPDVTVLRRWDFSTKL